ncbi:RNA polymerase sigma factor [Pedobacter duraquae]|uniref:RNA polymerase sigma-70 factor (ECF subfamily) n=1 Tax=Pedobacter duraquae TaxID=425511 RepID=A0A4R6IPP5_9SPHI|nr:sigma-70 family RNA polymerase sigma factor [Pedobacter duraquae]TDO23915.1 RNA polymerase sigma-70 factor (ECF subfamily) [Pedobacter duraquae]
MSNQNAYSLTDQQLVSQILAGDTKAYALLIKNTQGLVAQLTFKMIASPGDRKDLAQDVYLKVYKNLKSFKFQSKLSTWIGQITYNTCLHYLEKKKLVLLDAFLENDNEDPDVLESLQIKSQDVYQNDTEKLVFSRESAEILKMEIERLPPMQKLLITLYHQEELSYQEIVDITGLPEGTIKSHLFRARKTLKTNILTNYKREDL